MSGASTLCVWPPAADATGCCAAPAAVPATVPLPIDNAPGLSAIGYRIGTFTSFRQAMLDQVATPDLLFLGVSTTLTADAAAAATTIQVADFTAFPGAAPFRIKIDSEYLLVVSGAGTTLWTVVRGVDGSSAAVHTADDPVLLVPANPFAAWHAGVAGDYQTMFVELWAYLADVLTFYQERIANEAFMGTAALTDSVRRLAELVDSQPSPGAGATGLVSYTVARGQTTTVAAGLRVGSRATPTAPAVTFETATALTALGDYSAMPVAANAFVDQFAPLSGTAIIRQIVLAGTALGLRIGDFVVAVCNERLGALEVARAFRLQSVSVDRSSGTTTIAWSEFVPTTYDETRVPVSLYALSVTAGVFGNSAPAYAGLPPALTSPSATSPPYAPPYADNWDQQTDPAAWVGYPGSSIPPTPAVPANALDLDGVYDAVRASPEIPGWAVVVTGDTLPTAGVTTQNLTPSATAMLFHVTAAKAVSRTGYTLNARVTRLSLGTSEQIPSRIFPIRATTVFAGTSALVVQSLPLPVGGTSITLTGVFDQLQPGQTVIIQGPLNIGGQLAAESHVLAGPPQVNATLGTTVIALTTPLANQYVAAGTVVLGNVVAVTQGETVRDEQLGNGAGTPYQSFVLKKTPLTYLPSTNSAGLTAVADTLTVTVNGVAWTEVQSLLGQGADAQVFLTSTDDQQQTTVLFGDGINGAMPPTGVGNVHARVPARAWRLRQSAGGLPRADDRQRSRAAGRHQPAANHRRRRSAGSGATPSDNGRQSGNLRPRRQRRRLRRAGAAIPRHHQGDCQLGAAWPGRQAGADPVHAA